MPLIEGLGDEVTLVLGGFCVCVILTLAWFSTHTADIPLLREVGVIVVELSQRRNQGRNHGNRDGSEESSEQSQGDESSTVESVDAGRTEEQPRAEGDNLLNTGLESTPTTGSGGDRNEESAHVPKVPVASSTSEGTEDTTTSQNRDLSASLLPEVAEALTRESNQETLSTAPGHIPNTVGAQSQENPSESLIPKASVTVDSDCAGRHSSTVETPTEEELRQRRVRYFQSSGAPASSDATTSGETRPDSSGQADHEHRVSDPTSRLQGTSDEEAAYSSNQQATDSNTTSVTDSGDSTVQEQPEANSAQSETADSLRIRVKLKYMNETQRLVYASPYDTIGDFRRTHFQSELEDNKWVRFIYNGQDLRDDARTLQACNVGDNCTMHCLITAATRPASTREAVHEEEDDSFMGALMYPLFTLILLVVWYFRFTYRQYFSAMSTVCLIGISFLLGLSYISSLRTPEHRTQQQRGQQTSSTGATSTAGRAEHLHAD